MRVKLKSRATAAAAALATGAALMVIIPNVNAQTGQSTAAGVPKVPGWEAAGQNLSNTRNAGTEWWISPQNASHLAPRWTATLTGDVAATPTVSWGTIFVPDLGGKLWAINSLNGRPIWSKSISDYSGVTGDVSRTSPATSGFNIIFGDGLSSAPNGNGAHVMAANRFTGAKVWDTVIDPDPESMITTSPTVVGNTVLVGTASHVEFHGEEVQTTFRGAVVALDATTGKVKWRTYMAPSGYTGNSVWGSTFPVDTSKNELFVATGNNYTVPDGVCTVPDQDNCTAPPADDLTDAVVALDLNTGAVKWSFKTLTSDTGELDCDTCGPDFDFGSAPNVFHAMINGKDTTIVGAGQKSGVYWALDEATGKPIWHTVVGPGGDLGGIEWGSATDGKRIYVGIGNVDHEPYEITGFDGKKTTVTGGAWSALDPATGKILWQTADPNGSIDVGFISSANGVVFGSDVKPNASNMFALDGRTGKILWQFDSGGAVVGGAAIVDGSVYWGSGYWFASCGDPDVIDCGANNKLYALTPMWGTPKTTPPATQPPTTQPPTTQPPASSEPPSSSEPSAPSEPTQPSAASSGMPGMPGMTAMPGM